jgi:hypothetical protein
VALVVFTVTPRQGVDADQISISVRKTVRTAHDVSSRQSIVKEMMAASATHQEVDMQYIDPRHAAFLWDAMYELRPNQEVRCILPGRPNERWRIRYTGMGRGCPLIEINNFNEEDQTFVCFCFFLESRRHALLLSSGLPTIRDLDRHYAWTQLVNVIFDGAKWLRVKGFVT